MPRVQSNKFDKRDIMQPKLMERFKNDHYSCLCSAFLIMRFSDKPAYERIHKALVAVFANLGVKLLRADDKAYSENLFDNIKTYADGCAFGVALFDRIESNYFNPNVSLEVGYMMGRQKPVLLLKDDTIDTLPSDLVGNLYTSINIHDPASGLEQKVLKWMNDNSINPCSKRLSVVIRLEESGWDYATSKELVSGIPQFVTDAGPVYHRGIRSVGDTFVIDYDASQKFCTKLKEMHLKGDFDYLSKIEIIEINSSDEQPKLYDYIYIDRMTEKYEVQYCFLESFQGCEHLAKRAKMYLGDYTTITSECAIFISKIDGDIIYAHSNFLLPGYVYPTKLLIKKIKGIEYLLPLIMGKEGESIKNNRDLLYEHVSSVKYIFDTAFNNSLPFKDLLGAEKILIVDK